MFPQNGGFAEIVGITGAAAEEVGVRIHSGDVIVRWTPLGESMSAVAALANLEFGPHAEDTACSSLANRAIPGH
jgi:hypothetical protein